MLEIVDANDIIIGTESYERVHTDGLCHREVCVCFITPDQQLILQRRSLNKKIFAGMLDVTAGGHVEPGETYLQAALRETAEETGIRLLQEDLFCAGKIYTNNKDTGSPNRNNSFKPVYLHVYRGRLEDLQVEKNDGGGFVAIPLHQLTHMQENPSRELPLEFVESYYRPIFSMIKRALSQPPGLITASCYQPK